MQTVIAKYRATLQVLFCIIFVILSSKAFCLTPFFFDVEAFSIDEDYDGGDDYILARFDIDLDEEVTASIKVTAKLYNDKNAVVSTEIQTYKVIGQQPGYYSLKLIPTPNSAGKYSIHLSIEKSSETASISGISYNPELGSYPIPYFADIVTKAEPNRILVDFDVNLVQEIASDVKVNITLNDSDGREIDTKTFTYPIFYENSDDYMNLIFAPPKEDLYIITFTVYPKNSGNFTDSRLVNVIYPPGTGAYFRNYDASINDDSVKVNLDVDLYYDVNSLVNVEAILYDSTNDPVAYEYISYFTYGIKDDKKSILLKPEQLQGGFYYIELIVYIGNRPSSYGYITDIPLGSFTITATAGNNGTISPSGKVKVGCGKSQKFSIKANEGYHIADVKIDKESAGVLNSYTFEEVTSDHTIEASFSAYNYTITAKAGEGGTISPDKTITIEHGGSQGFTISTSKGYQIADVKVDGESKGTLTEYTFTDVKANHTIEATFEIIIIKGDINGDGNVMSNDAMMAISYIVDKVVLTDTQLLAGDMDDNGEINIKDVMLILRKSAGLLAPPKSSHADVKIALSEVYGVAGGKVAMPIKLDNISEISCGFIQISYDEKVLKANQVKSAHDMLFASSINKPGIVYIAFAINDKLGGRILSDIKFEIMADDACPLNIDHAEFYSADSSSLMTIKVDGLFYSWAKPAEKNALFQNFPNPFNPETWIPYQLKHDSDVRIIIYSQSGELVRELNLGHKQAGVYITNGRAAYWDGKNSSGEKVASGVYFYSIKAGNFHSIRKMLIVE